MIFGKKKTGVGVTVSKECKRHYKHVSHVRTYTNLGGYQCSDETGVSVTHEIDGNTVWVRDLSRYGSGSAHLTNRDDVVALKEFLSDILEVWK